MYASRGLLKGKEEVGEVGEVLGEVVEEPKLEAREKIVGAVAVELVELVLGVVEWRLRKGRGRVVRDETR